jgi:hypothetical protein
VAGGRDRDLRDVDLFVRRYGCRSFGPWLFWRSNIRETDVRRRDDRRRGRAADLGNAHIERARAALRELLQLPFERVITAQGEPLHDRAAFEQALELPAWRE